MTRQEALEFIATSDAQSFRYGDLSYSTGRHESIDDIRDMDEDAWGDGEIYEDDDNPVIGQ